MVLLFSAVLALTTGAALHNSVVEARAADFRVQEFLTRNLAEATLQQLVQRVAERWVSGGGSCAADQYCRDDFPGVESLLARVPNGWTVSADIAPAVTPWTPRLDTAQASSARAYRWRTLELRVEIDGRTPAAVAAGMVIPEAVNESVAEDLAP